MNPGEVVFSPRPRSDALRLVAFAAALLVTTACQERTETSTTGTTKGPTGTTDDRGGIEIPGVVGISLGEARETLQAADVPFVVHPKLSDEPPGTVIGQSPRGGERLSPGDFVYLFVSDERPRCYEYAECAEA